MSKSCQLLDVVSKSCQLLDVTGQKPTAFGRDTPKGGSPTTAAVAMNSSVTNSKTTLQGGGCPKAVSFWTWCPKATSFWT